MAEKKAKQAKEKDATASKEQKIGEQKADVKELEPQTEKTEKGKKPEKPEKTEKPEKPEKEAKASAKKAKARRRNVPLGNACINASYNNTIITLTDPSGNVIAWSSAGACGFRGTRKATPYAAQVAAEKAAEKAKLFGLDTVHVFIKGVGNGREQAMRGLVANGFNILSIQDVTPIPHNGCRKRKPRRM